MSMKKLFLLLFTLCLWSAFALPASSEESEQIFLLDGQSFPVGIIVGEESGETCPEGAEAEGIQYLDLNDEDAQDLISLSGKRFNWSSNGETLMVFGKNRQLTVDGAGKIRFSDGREKNVGGSMRTIGGRHAMTADLFIYLLDFMAEAAEPGEPLKLLHLIGAPKAVNNNLGARLIIDTDSKPVYTIENAEPHNLVLKFKNSAWGEALKLHLNCVDIESALAPDNSSDLLLTFKTSACWALKLQRGVDSRQIIIAKVFSSENAYSRNAESRLLDIEARETVRSGADSADASEDGAAAAGEELRFTADGPFKYVWSFCPSCHKVRADLIGVSNAASVKKSSGKCFRDLQINELSGRSAVVSLTFFLAEGFRPEAEVRDEDNALSLFIIKDAAAPSGTVCGSGHVGRAEAGAMTVVLDPGHGGGDPGCRSRHFGVCEKEVTLDVALRLRDLLEEMGINVVMTRETDRDVSWRGSPDKVELQSRCDVANDIEADYFISLHCNANVYTSVHGSSVYWYKPEDRELSAYFTNALGDMGFYWLGNIRDGFYVLRHTDMPAVLIEMAFLTNYRDGSKLVKPECRQAIAEDLAEVFRQILEDRSAP